MSLIMEKTTFILKQREQTEGYSRKTEISITKMPLLNQFVPVCIPSSDDS